MSKKTSKILMVAVALVLALSMIFMVACGGAKPLDGATAMETLQEGFNEATDKTVEESITVGGVALKVTSLVDVKINNVNIDLKRTYSGKKLTLEATVKNLDASVNDSLFSLISGFVKGLNIDSTAVKNFSNVTVEIKVIFDASNFSLKVEKFTIKGLDKVVNKKGEQLSFLKDGNGDPLGAVYSPAELQNKEITAEKMAEFFEEMNEYGGGESGNVLRKFIADNYQMISLYNFGTVTVDKDKISSDAKADFSKLYALGQSILDGYSATKIGDTDKTIGGTVNDIFGTTNVEDAISTVVDMGNAKMSGTLKADGDNWKLDTMTVEQNITVSVSSSLLNGALGLIEVFAPGFELPGFVTNIIDAIGSNGISTPLNVKTVAKYTY